MLVPIFNSKLNLRVFDLSSVMLMLLGQIPFVPFLYSKIRQFGIRNIAYLISFWVLVGATMVSLPIGGITLVIAVIRDILPASIPHTPIPIEQVVGLAIIVAVGFPVGRLTETMEIKAKKQGINLEFWTRNTKRKPDYIQ